MNDDTFAFCAVDNTAPLCTGNDIDSRFVLVPLTVCDHVPPAQVSVMYRYQLFAEGVTTISRKPFSGTVQELFPHATSTGEFKSIGFAKTAEHFAIHFFTSNKIPTPFRK